ncbi:hypothetical protein QBC35DRAFT_204176 [Podospora australis]|uniref:Uncharacterized protein n=1 Tax=Podospora australis TaxID=1536484 RepID=A0AAN7AL85_9PEZI|nr:hypothetical protein QBC35DRAFT_204176 [Podospora australis]
MATMYADMQPQEELANLFARNLTLTQPAPAPIPAPAPAPVEETPAQPAPAKIVYISQHYNHSAHLARQNAQQQQQQSPPPRPASEPPQNEHAEVERVLRNYSVDPSGLSSAQLQLFRTVDDPQRLRLIELWRACPPKNGSDNPTLVWGVTTVDQEETLARMRYEQQQQIQQQLEEEQMQMEMQMQLEQEQQQHFQRQQASQQQQQQREFAMSLDGTPVTPTQTNDGRWVPTADDFQYMEEYMLAGYGDEICRRGGPVWQCGISRRRWYDGL